MVIWEVISAMLSGVLALFIWLETICETNSWVAALSCKSMLDSSITAWMPAAP